MKKSNDTIGNRTRDLPACSAVPQPTALPRNQQPVQLEKQEIKSAQVARGISRLNSSRCNITEQMKTLLLVWVNEKQMAGDSVSELHNEEAEALKQRIAFGEAENEDKEKSHSIPAEDLKEVFSCWNKLSKLMKDYHADIAAVEISLYHFNDILMAHFWKVQKSRIKQ